MPVANVHSVVKPAAARSSPPMSIEAVAYVWNSPTVRLVRNRLFHEFAVFILGGGNALILCVFWPGWLLFGLAFWIAGQLLA